MCRVAHRGPLSGALARFGSQNRNHGRGWFCFWVGGSPYFRVFNPIIQRQKFDPIGDYVREWVPEVGRLPKKNNHEPWTATAEEQKAAEVVIGEVYPSPIVDHPAAGQRALDAYSALKDSVTSGS